MRIETHGERLYLFVGPLQGVPGRVGVSDHVSGQRFEVYAAIRYEEKV